MIKEIESENLQDTKFLSRILKAYLFALIESPVLAHDRGQMSIYHKAISVQTLSFANLILLLKIKDYKDDDHMTVISRSMVFRSLIEVTANINFFANRPNNDELANKFLSTANKTYDMLMNINTSQDIEMDKWTNHTVTRRIKKLDNDYHRHYYNEYYLCSSLAHSEASYITLQNYIEDHKFKLHIFAGTTMLFQDLFDMLYKSGVWLKAKDIMFTELINEYKTHLKETK